MFRTFHNAAIGGVLTFFSSKVEDIVIVRQKIYKMAHVSFFCALT